MAAAVIEYLSLSLSLCLSYSFSLSLSLSLQPRKGEKKRLSGLHFLTAERVKSGGGGTCFRERARKQSHYVHREQRREGGRERRGRKRH